MKMFIPGVGTSVNLSRLARLDRLDRYGAVGKVACAAIGRCLQHRREVWLRRLEEIALEFLAAIVVIVIVVILTERAHRENL